LWDGLFFWSETRKRKSRKQKMKEKGRRSYRKGKQFEKKAYKFLGSKGFKVHKERIRFKGGEIDGFASKGGRHYAVEAKNTRQKVSVKAVRKLRKKIDRSAGFAKGGVIVSKKGFTKEAEKEAKKLHIHALKYKQKRRKTDEWGW
jgi:predicted RecB family endonuclease